MPDVFFQDLTEQTSLCQTGNRETIPFCLHIMLFLHIVLPGGTRDTRLERKLCREGKIRTQRVAQEEWEKRRETEKLTRRRNKMESKSLPNRCQYKPGDILLQLYFILWSRTVITLSKRNLTVPPPHQHSFPFIPGLLINLNSELMQPFFFPSLSPSGWLFPGSDPTTKSSQSQADPQCSFIIFTCLSLIQSHGAHILMNCWFLLKRH